MPTQPLLPARCLRALSESATQAGSEVVAQQIPTQAGSEIVAQPLEAPIQVVPVPASADAPVEPAAVPAATCSHQYDFRPSTSLAANLRPTTCVAASLVQPACGVTTNRLYSTCWRQPRQAMGDQQYRLSPGALLFPLSPSSLVEVRHATDHGLFWPWTG